MEKFFPKIEKENKEFSLYDTFFEQYDKEENESLYKKQLYVLEEDKFIEKEQSNLSLMHKSLINRLILEDFSVYPIKKDTEEAAESLKKKENTSKKKFNEDKDSKKIDEIEKFWEDEGEYIKDLHRINNLTFSPFYLNYFNKNNSSKEDNINEKITKEKEKENKLFKIINFDYNNYEFNEDLLFNICQGFIDLDKLKEENIKGEFCIKDQELNKKEVQKNVPNNPNSKKDNKQNKKEEKENKKEENNEELMVFTLITEINIFIKKKENIDFYKEEINNYYKAKDLFEKNLKTSSKEKKIFFKNWLNKFHRIEALYNSYKVQIMRTETINKVKSEKLKKKIEEEKIKKINEENNFIEELKKIREKALRKKTLQEKGILSTNVSMYTDRSYTTNSSAMKDSSFGTISIRVPNTERKSHKKKTEEKERFDWMIKKSDNFFAQY